MFTNALCYAQFPAPRSFEYELDYIYMDEVGYCNGEWVTGPVNCSHFKWQVPDVSNTETQLTGFNVYLYPCYDYQEGMEIPFSEGIVILHIDYYESENYLETGEVFLLPGVLWMTAIYSSPEGESAPSNIQICNGNAISINKVGKPFYSLVYNREKGGVEITDIDNAVAYTIFRLDGTTVKSNHDLSGINFIDTKNIKRGVYIIKITTEDSVISEKIIIE